MGVKEVTQLRKSGNLQAALEMAEADFQQEQNDWTRSALFWVYRDYCNLALQQNNSADANEWYVKCRDITEQMNQDDNFVSSAMDKLSKALTPHFSEVKQCVEESKDATKVADAYRQVAEFYRSQQLAENLHEDFGWVIYRYLKRCFRSLSSIDTRSALFEYMKLKNPRPSLLHSQILNLVSQISEYHTDLKLLPFLQLWGIDNLSYDDLMPSSRDGRTFAPLVDRIISRCFTLGYTLDKVIVEFCKSPRITEDRIISIFSKEVYYKLYDQRNADDRTFLNTLAPYIEGINSRNVRSENHSKILNSVVWRAKKDENFPFKTIFEKWGMQSFRSDDWIRTPGKDEADDFPSLAETAIKLYNASLKSSGGIGQASEQFGALLEKASISYRDDFQHQRHLGQFYFTHGEPDRALSIYRNLLLTQSNFYLWQELAEMVDNDELKIGALAKALSGPEPDEFTGKIHIQLAELLIQQNKFGEAASELNIVEKTYNTKGWNLPGQVTTLRDKLRGVEAVRCNYFRLIEPIEDYLYQDIPEVDMIAVEQFNDKEGNKRLLLTDGSKVNLPVKMSRFRQLRKAKLGQIFKVRIANSNGKSKPLTLKGTEKPLWSILPIEYGYVEYINEGKSVYHILTAKPRQVFLHFKQRGYAKGDFLSFRTYEKEIKGRKELQLVDIVEISPEECLPNFSNGLAAIDNVNEQKGVAHFVFGPSKPSGTIRLSELDFKPEVGQSVHIYYCYREGKDRQKRWSAVKVMQTDQVAHPCIKQITGLLELRYRNPEEADWSEYAEPDYGFVENCYVAKELLQQHNIKEDTEVNATAVYTGDSKWKVFNFQILS